MDGIPFHRPRHRIPCRRPCSGTARIPRPGTDLSDEQLATQPLTESAREGGARGWLRLALIAVSFLVIGFVAGWIVRGDQGDTTVLAPPAEAEQQAITTTAEPPPVTTVAEPEVVAPPPRNQIALAVLNGGTVTGAAASTAERAEGLGYRDVEADNAPAQSGPDTVYFIPGQRPAAERVAEDLLIAPVKPLPTSGELADAVPDGTQVVVVLGSE